MGFRRRGGIAKLGGHWRRVERTMRNILLVLASATTLVMTVPSSAQYGGVMPQGGVWTGPSYGNNGQWRDNNWRNGSANDWRSNNWREDRTNDWRPREDNSKDNSKDNLKDNAKNNIKNNAYDND